MGRDPTVTATAFFGVAGSANAITAKWCFRWAASYNDADGAHDDYLKNETTIGGDDYSVVEAAYGIAMIQKLVNSNWVYVWLGTLDADGCTPTMGNAIDVDSHYIFTQYLEVVRGNRVVRVHPDSAGWMGDIDTITTSVSTPSILTVRSSYNAPLLLDSSNARLNLMPAITRLIADQANTLDFPSSVVIDVKATNCGGHTGCGRKDDDGDGDYDRSEICFGNSNTDEKVQIAHEFGHVVSNENNGPTALASSIGTEGVFNGGSYCDCTLVGSGTAGHCPTSREFTGLAQQEGFSNFIAAAAFNNRDESSGAEDGEGTLEFYKEVRKWRGTHNGTLPLLLSLPGSPAYLENYAAELGPTHNVQWVNYECPSATSSMPGARWSTRRR